MPRKRSALSGLLAGAVVAALCAGGLWYAYTKVSNRQVASETVPLIRADQGATKVKPDQPGGEAAPEQDSSAYNPGEAATKTERLLPPPEQPMAKPPPPPEAPPEPAPLPTQNIAVTPTPQAAPASPPSPPPSSSQPSTLTQPPTTKTAQVAPAAAPHAAVPTPPPASPKPAPQPPAAPPATAPPPAAAATPPQTAAAGGGFRIQIAATTDDAAAHKTWDGLQKAHPDLLGSLGLTVVRVDLGDKGIFFRVQAGPLADRAQADKLCGQLKAISIGCIIVKPQ